MAHRLAPGAEAEVELDEIWIWTAKESGSVDTADHLIDSIAERFFLLDDTARSTAGAAGVDLDFLRATTLSTEFRKSVVGGRPQPQR